MFYNVELLVEKMKSYEISAVISSTKENIRYFTGFEPVIKTLNPYNGQCYTVITLEQPDVVHVVHSIGEVDQILDARTNIGHVFTYGTFYREHGNLKTLSPEEERLNKLSDISESYSNGQEALVGLLKSLRLEGSRIGIDEEGIKPIHLSHLREQFGKSEFKPCSNIIRAVRAIKTEQEINSLAYSARCIENAIDAVAENIYEGISEVEIANIFKVSIAQQDALPILPMIKVGRHAIGGQRRQSQDIKLKAGDLIWFDCDIVSNGYWADIARVLCFKHLKPEYKKFDALYKGQLLSMEEIKPGMKGKEVFDLTMNAVHDLGFPEYRRHHVGHGIGLEPYELPILAPNSEDIVQEGMVLSVETPYYEFGLGALHIEDPVLISEKGNTVLTRKNGNIKIVG